jgi:hypothetical protein
MQGTISRVPTVVGKTAQGQELQPPHRVLSVLSENVESLKTYIQDAQAEGDQELAEFFSADLEHNLEAGRGSASGGSSLASLLPRAER